MLLAVGLCLAGLVVLRLVRDWVPGPAELLRHLPRDGAAVVYIDVTALRRAGVLDLLAGSRSVEDTEYRAFVERSGFNYRDHLDAVLASFRGEEVFILLRGRFDWSSLRRYVAEGGGECRDDFCRMAASTAGRHISFFPLRPRMMALAVSPDPRAASALRSPRGEAPAKIPGEPVWLSVAPALLRSTRGLPPGVALFLAALGNAQSVTLAGGADGENFQASLEAECASAADGAVLAAQLEKLTDVLRKMIAREKQSPNPRDLSGVLTAGTFRREDRRVYGRWPVRRAFLEALAAGGK